MFFFTRQSPHLVYATLPKCACSSVGQVLHFMDHGRFYTKGLVHDAEADVGKCDADSGRDELRALCTDADYLGFTVVRNPYTRLLSAFADKIFGFNRLGKRYRGGTLHTALAPYGLRWGPQAQIANNFHIFMRFVGDSVETGQPIAPDPHYAPMSELLGASMRLMPEWRLGHVGHVESLKKDLQAYVTATRATLDLSTITIPRDNQTTMPPLPLSVYFGPDEREIMNRCFGRDFDLFGYGRDLDVLAPVRTVDAEAVRHALNG